MSLKSAFKTDAKLEVDGNWKQFSGLTINDFRVKIARGGGANKGYGEALMKRGKRFLTALESPSNDKEERAALELKTSRLMRELLVEHCIKGWQTFVDGEWKDGMEFEDDSLLEPTRENLLTVLSEVPELERLIQAAVQDIANFKHAALEEAAKN